MLKRWITDKLEQSMQYSPRSIRRHHTLFNGNAEIRAGIVSRLVVIKESNEPRYKRARKIRKSIWGLVSIPKDILVYTEEELDRWKDVPMSFVSNIIISEGKIIYEKE